MKNVIIGLVSFVVYMVLLGVAMIILTSPLAWLEKDWSEGERILGGMAITLIGFLAVVAWFYFKEKVFGKTGDDEIAPGGNDNMHGGPHGKF